MRVQLKPQAQAVKARPRRYDPVKTGWLASCIVALGAFGLFLWNIQAVWASPAMAVPKRDTFRSVSDYQAVNSQVEQTPKFLQAANWLRTSLPRMAEVVEPLRVFGTAHGRSFA